MSNPSSTSSSELVAAIRIGLRVVLVAVAVFATLVVLFVAIPEGNDIAEVHLDKHQRLRALPSPKIVFVGGSNLMYGLDSAGIEAGLGVPTVNMGLNGYLGPRFLMNEVKDDVRSGDVVVLSFEYESYFEPNPYDTWGMGDHHLVLVKLRPESIRYLDHATMYWRAFLGLPRAVQSKLYRLVEDSKQRTLGLAPTPPWKDPELWLADGIEVRGGFNPNGDLVSHLQRQWPFERWPGPDLKDSRISVRVLDMIRDFRDEMRAKGVTVVVAPAPAPEDWYAANRVMVDDTFDRIAALLQDQPTSLLGRPAEYVLPVDYFFDNVNHLNSEGRPLRTAAVARHLSVLIGKRKAEISMARDRPNDVAALK